MDESKELIGMAVSVLLAVLVLSGVMALITLSYNMWNLFSQQDLANRKMKAYVNYSSFDDTTVRGQEVISLLSSTQGTPFVLIYDNSGVLQAAAYTSVSYEFKATRTNYHSSFQMPDEILGTIIGTHSDPIAISSIISTSSATKWEFNGPNPDTEPTMQELQEWFLDRGLNHVDPDTMSTSRRYCGYQSCLVYDADSSTDIAGVILVEQSPYN